MATCCPSAAWWPGTATWCPGGAGGRVGWPVISRGRDGPPWSGANWPGRSTALGGKPTAPGGGAIPGWATAPGGGPTAPGGGPTAAGGGAITGCAARWYSA